MSKRVRHVMRKSAAGIVGLLLLTSPALARADNNSWFSGAIFWIATGIACVTASLNDDGTQAGEEGFARQGWLAGVSGTYAIPTFEDFIEDELEDVQGRPVSASVDNALGISGHAGYRCHPRFGAALQAESSLGFEGDASTPGIGKFETFEVESLLITSNAKGYLLTGRYQPYLLLGGGVMSAKLTERLGFNPFLISPVSPPSVREDGFTIRFGGGLDYYATRHVVLNVGVDYVVPFGDVEDLEYISIGWGLEYRF